MTNREKFICVFGIDPEKAMKKKGWLDCDFVDTTTKCCDNCKRHNGTVLENLTCEAHHGIHDPRYQACIAFERR